jgi:hypothetical protein
MAWGAIMGDGISRRGWLRALLGGLLGPWLARRAPAAGVTSRVAAAGAPLRAAADARGWLTIYTYDAANQPTGRVTMVLYDRAALAARPRPVEPGVTTYTYDGSPAPGTPGDGTLWLGDAGGDA